MSAYRKFTPPTVASKIEILGGTPAKDAKAAKVDAPAPQTLAALATLAGIHLQTHESEAAGDWEFDPLSLAELHRESIARRCRLGYSESQAARWAYGAALDDWHRQNGEKPLPGRCAGCGAHLGPHDNVLALPDGAAVHSADTACLIASGRRWRTAAAEGLAKLGIHPPLGWVEE